MAKPAIGKPNARPNVSRRANRSGEIPCVFAFVELSFILSSGVDSRSSPSGHRNQISLQNAAFFSRQSPLAQPHPWEKRGNRTRLRQNPNAKPHLIARAAQAQTHKAPLPAKESRQGRGFMPEGVLGGFGAAPSGFPLGRCTAAGSRQSAALWPGHSNATVRPSRRPFCRVTTP